MASTTETSEATGDLPPEEPIGDPAAEGPDGPGGPEGPEGPKRSRWTPRRIAMRPRRVLVKVHRWLAFALMAWLVVMVISGAWLVGHDAIESWLNPARFEATSGDVGPQAALEASRSELPKGALVYGVTMPRNGRGVYQVGAEIETPGVGGADPTYKYKTVYVDPGTGNVNGARNDEEGFSWWLYRGHMYLWQDHGIFGVFDAETGWCRPNAKGAEPGGLKGIVCDVIPDGGDTVAWFGVAWIVVLLSGFYLWYWPGVRRWATALVIQRKRGRFAFHMSVHKLVGLVVWVPLLVIAFTGIAFAFPNLKGWYENATPAQRGQELWVAPDKALESGKADGRDPIGLDRFVEILDTKFPERVVESVAPPDSKTGVYTAWVTRGFSPWTREQGAGNVWVTVDQYSGKVLYDGTPEEGNVFDQLWSDWSFPLHTGDFAGTPSRIIWIGIALTPVVLGGTGIAMYAIRRSKRSRRAERAAADDTAGSDGPDEQEPADVSV